AARGPGASRARLCSFLTDEPGLREALQRVRTGSLSRRTLVRGLLGLGLPGPLIAEVCRAAGIAHAQPKRAPFTPARRGGGGELKLLWWQAPTILNPHLAIGVKDGDGSPSSSVRPALCVL